MGIVSKHWLVVEVTFGLMFLVPASKIKIAKGQLEIPFGRTVLVKCKKGQMLIEVLVAISLMAIVSLAFIQMFNNQIQESRYLKENLARLDGQALLLKALGNTNSCEYILKNPAQLTFDSTAILPGNPVYITPTLPIYADVMAGVPGPVVAQVGEFFSPLANFKVSNIRLKIKSGGGDIYNAEWVIDFDGSDLLRPLRPAIVSTIIYTNPASASVAKSVLSCGQNTTTPPGLLCGLYVGEMAGPPSLWTDCLGHNPSVDCPPGYTKKTFSYNGDAGHSPIYTCQSN